MITQKKLLLIILFLNLTCKQDGWRDDLNTPNYQEIHKELLLRKTDSFSLPGKEQNREEAILNFLTNIAQSNTSVNDSILSEEEYKNFFLPHTLGTGTSLDTTPLDTYWVFFTDRRRLGLEKISNALKKSTVTRVEAEFDTRRRDYGPWISWKVNSVVLKDNKGKVSASIDQIKLVACYQKKCKVAVVSP